MGDILITAPTAEPITVAQLRSHLRDPADPDATLELLISAAREHVENETGLALIDQVRRLTLDAWPHGMGDGLGWWDGVRDGATIGTAPRYVDLPRGPLISISSVITFDNADNPTTWPASNYFADVGAERGRLALNDGATWPLPTRAVAGIRIDYRAGWANAAAVPSDLRLAVLQIAAHWYENRELISTEATNRVPFQASRIIGARRIVKL